LQQAAWELHLRACGPGVKTQGFDYDKVDYDYDYDLRDENYYYAAV
jgi:hypothetical protein